MHAAKIGIVFGRCSESICGVQMTDASKPVFHVVLSDRDQWVVEVERIRTFKHYGTAADFARQSDAWLRVQSIFTDEAMDALQSAH
jgi:hypothetical protein